ncbi:integrase catalytic domain-containing protein [Trichonephila clavipes]|nr:integrase catalytic domain-containing protein [Trichonephila clavipes]
MHCRTTAEHYVASVKSFFAIKNLYRFLLRSRDEIDPQFHHFSLDEDLTGITLCLVANALEESKQEAQKNEREAEIQLEKIKLSQIEKQLELKKVRKESEKNSQCLESGEPGSITDKLESLGERVNNLLTYVSQEDLSNYVKIKELILREFEPTPQECLSNFKKALKLPSENYVQFASRLSATFDYYCQLRKVNEFRSLCDLIISDKIFKTLDRHTMNHTATKQGETYFKPQQLGRECDVYLSARGKVSNDLMSRNPGSGVKTDGRNRLETVSTWRQERNSSNVFVAETKPNCVLWQIERSVEANSKSQFVATGFEKGRLKNVFLNTVRALVENKYSQWVEVIDVDVNVSEFVPLADDKFNIPDRIDMLLGAEIFYELLKPGKFYCDNSHLVLQNTVFGYVVSGSVDQVTENRVHCGLIVDDDLNKTLKKFWEIEGVHIEPKVDTEVSLCEDHFVRTHRRNCEGGYVVSMTLNKDPSCLGNSKDIAIRRLNSLWKRLSKDSRYFSLYAEFLKKYEKLDHLERVVESSEPPTHYYIPHHGVLRPEKLTTKLRIVFNGSSPTTTGISLNDILLKGEVKEDVFESEVLSVIAKLYDPLGFLGPVIAKAEVFLQQLWQCKLDWNDVLPNSIGNEIVLQGFADASEVAYGAVVYLQCFLHNGAAKVSILARKSRVAPIRVISIPRLELCACVLLAQLILKIHSTLRLNISDIVLHTDSTIALAWLNTPANRLKTFVANRVAKVQELTEGFQWNHVPSVLNPADLVSRGLRPCDLPNLRLWWHGPQFLEKGKLSSEETSLSPVKEYSDGLLRVGGRLSNSDLPYVNKHPAILPGNHNLTVQIIVHFHRKNLHTGASSLLHYVREKFWPLNGRSLCRKVVHECLVCFKSRPLVTSQLMGNLPRDRIVPDYPFNCSGANKELKRFLKLIEDSDDNLAGFLSAEGIEWKFIPPRAPSFSILRELSVAQI